MTLILASTSLYRRDLLQRLTPDFVCIAPDVDERAFKNHGLAPLELARQLASEKSSAVAARYPDAIVIGSDQVAELDGDALGKPETTDTAISELTRLAGRTHRLLTAVCIHSPQGTCSFVNTTQLTMRRLTADEIMRYIERDQPLDCAGSYRIESLGIALFDAIETEDFTAIIGLPLMELARHLRELGVAIP